MSLIIAWSFAKKDKMSSPVAYCPVFVFLGFFTNSIFSNKIIPNCLGEAILNSSPACSKMLFSSLLMSSVKATDNWFRKSEFRFIPSISIAVKTDTKGVSISLKSLVTLPLSNSLVKCSFNCSVISASSTAYSV